MELALKSSTQQLRRGTEVVPVVYFTLLGAYDILDAVWKHELTWYHTAVNAVFFVPLLFRHWMVQLISGVLFTIGCTYLLVAGAVQLVDLPSDKSENEWLIMAFLVCTLLCSLGLCYTGIHKRGLAMPSPKTLP